MSTKRILSLVLALVMVLGTFGTVFAAETGNDKIDWLIDQGIVQGDETGDLKLNATIDRASVAKLVVEALDLGSVAEGMKGYKTSFSDVPVTHWANGFINVVSARGIMIGDAGKFMPGNQISYAEVLTILVRIMDGLTADEEKAAVWPTTYIAKANELGILKDVTVVSYQEAAIRERIFEMFYNAMNNMEVGNYSIVKAIVLENNRVERIDEDEVVVEVLRELQRANYADASRYEQGDQERFTIDLKGQNVEEMLGKVYDFTLNKDKKVVSVKLDTTYNYYAGRVNDITRSKFNGYTVELDERFREKDERIFRTYHNDKSYAYIDFDRDFDKVDYARYTVKNGKVLFVDAYTFDDIAPVQENRSNGVYVYNDFRDARVEKVEPRALVVAYNDGVFSRIAVEDIKENDVVHVYNRNSVIVRLDSVVTDEYVKVERRNSDNNYYAHIGDNSYRINDIDYRRPVFAHDSKSYETLLATRAQSELAKFYKEEVTILVDINNDLQLFGAEVEYNEGMTIVDQILARGQGRFVQPNDERLILDETYDSRISFVDRVTGNETTNRRLTEFNKGDLTFTEGSDGEIDQLVRIEKFDEVKRLSEVLNAANIGSGFISTNVDRYQVLSRTNVFVIREDRGNIVNITGTTLADVKKMAKADTNMKAYVLTDKQVFDLGANGVISNRHRLTERTDLAHTIIITEIEYAGATYDGETALVTNVYTATRPHHVVGYGPDNEGGKRIERDATSTASLVGLKNDDIVSLKLTKTDDPKVATWDVLILGNKVLTESYRVVSFDSRGEYREIVLEDATGAEFVHWLVPGFQEYGTITRDSVVTFHEANSFGDIDVIRVYSSNTKVTANGSSSEEINGLVTYINTTAGSESFSVDNKTPYFLNAKTILTDKNDNVVAMGAQAVINALTSVTPPATGDQVKVTIVGDVMTIKRLATKAELNEAAAQNLVDTELAKVSAAYEVPFGTAVGTDTETAVKTLVEAQVDTAKVTVSVARVGTTDDYKVTLVPNPVVGTVKAEKDVTVTIAAASTDATVTSAVYVVNESAKTITMSVTEDVAVFKTKLTSVAGATFEVYESDETTVRAGNMVDGDKVIVTAQDGTTKSTYTVTVQ